MNKDKVFEHVKSELEYIQSESLKYGISAETMTAAMKNIAYKSKQLIDVLSCIDLKPSDTINTAHSVSTKQLILDLFDKDELIDDLIGEE